MKDINNKTIRIADSNWVLTVFLILSFSIYLFPFNQVTLAIPILFLSLFSLKEVLKKKNKLFYSLRIFFSKRLIGLSCIFPVISLVGFFLSEDKSLENIMNFFMIYVIGISSLIILVDSKRLLETMISSLHISGIICICLYFCFNFREMFFSLNSNIRFTNYSFHFNLIAYIVTGFSGAILFQILSKKHVIFNTILLIISILIIVAAQSRGSLFSIIIAMIFSYLLHLMKKNIRPQKVNTSKSLALVFSAVFLVFLLTLFYLFNSDAHFLLDGNFKFLFDTINAKLELSTEYRGLGTGLTGRTDVWNELIKLLNIRILAFGNGYRTYTEVFEAVDNGYLVVLYENGLFCLLILLVLIIEIMVAFIKGYMNSLDQTHSALYLSYLYLIIAFLANNFVARFLLSVGNPFSAFIIVLLFLSPIFLKQLKTQTLTDI
jgi:hypothetical protein